MSDSITIIIDAKLPVLVLQKEAAQASSIEITVPTTVKKKIVIEPQF